jgi:hypothetical protein
MNNKFFPLFVFFIVLSTYTYSTAQKVYSNSYHYFPGIGISLTKFNSLIDSFNYIMQYNKSMTEQNYITAVRLDNTISFNVLDLKDVRFKKFKKLFEPKYLNLAIATLDGLPSRGGGFYSKKYDLYIGGTPNNNSSMYSVIVDNR